MASSSVAEDEDLIDLENAGVAACVSRSTNLPEASAEELEHLLDVCPPKLEQKLSLTRRQEAIRENPEKDDILVTLGHDQLVPRRKRIDVVSSETIKRIRDITKNLEPVMRSCATSLRTSDDEPIQNGDSVDGSSKYTNSREVTNDPRRNDVTYETQTINSAFDFLSELEDADDDDDQPPDKKRRITSADGCATRKPPSCYPLEPTCLIEDKSSIYREIDRANHAIESTETSSVLDGVNDVSIDDDHENLGFEVSPLSKKSQEAFIEKKTNFPNVNNGQGKFGRRVEEREIRKSWSEGESRGLVFHDDLSSERSTSIEIDCFSEPSTSNGITKLLRRSSRNIVRQVPEHSASSSECSDVDWSWVEEYETPSISTSQFRVSSTSKRDYNNKRGNAKTQSTRNISERTTKNNISCVNARPSSAPTRVSNTNVAIATTSFLGESDAIWTTSGEERKRACAASEETRDSNGSVAMSVVETGKCSVTGRSSLAPSSLAFDDFCIGHDDITNVSSLATNNDPAVITANSTNCIGVSNENSRSRGNFGATTNDEINARASVRNNNNRVDGSANSFIRASMRRLRHLRLPDAERNIERRIVADSLITSSPSVSILSGPNSLPDIALIAPDILAAQTNGSLSGNSIRPSSAPVATRDHAGNNNSASNNVSGTPRRGRRHASRTTGGRSQERANRASSARNNNNNNSNNNNTSGENTEIGVQTGITVATSPQRRNNAGSTTQLPNSPGSNGASRRNCERQRDADRDNERGEDDDEDENPLGRWPHPLSPALACLGCTLGLFNISRFAILSIEFGANFIVQFLVLSLILGIPLLTLQVCLGQRLAAGSVDMWRISPIFHGVGIALLVAQAFIGIYSIIGVSWMFIYFRDSFITKQERYRWAEPFLLYRDDTRMLHNTTTYKLHETVPDYFSGVVLQRHHLNEPDPGVITLKFQVAFNLAVVWMIVFVSLSKGLRSYGKVVYVFTLVPVFGTLVLCTKLLGLTPPGSIHQLFPATVWSEFFINNKSWVAASSEVFLTWGLLGAAAMQVAAHNKHKHLLQRDTSLVVVLTLVVLLLSAFLANTCVQILRHYGYTYTTSSFERISGYSFMRHVNQPPPSGYSNTPERFMSHASFLLGQRVVRPGADLGTESGYQVLRLSTELVPATLAVLGTEQVSPFWAVLFYFILILFGIAQQLAIWHCVITGIMAINTKMTKLWETTITFFSCACAYILGLPMATELGIYVVYYLDYTVGGAWWIMILYLVQVGAVFAVRGRPHTGETVVAELFPPTGRCLRHWAGPLLSFTWNVILPVALMVLSIAIFKSSNFRDLYVYRRTSRDYWSVWARQLGAAIQLTPILIIPAVAIIQTCRYLNSGPPDIFDRIQLLYRPPLDNDDTTSSQTHYGNETSTSIHGNGILPSSNDLPFEDPPPKYTPPPSYTTATGARIAKMLRQSFRRSVRRIANVLGETSAPRSRPALQPPPPDYATVLVEMNQSVVSQNITIHEPRPDVTDTTRNSVVPRHDRNRPSTIDRSTRISTIDRSSIERTHSTMDRGRTRMYNNVGSSNLTAADVANLLRSSIRRGAARTQQSLCRSAINDIALTTTTTMMMTSTTTAASVENLVNAAVPINEDSLVYDKDVPLVHDKRENDDDEDEDDDDIDEKKTVNEMDNSVSVI